MKKGIILAFTALTLVLGTVSCSKSDDNGTVAPTNEELISNKKWQLVKAEALLNGAIIFEQVQEYDDCTKTNNVQFLSNKEVHYVENEFDGQKCHEFMDSSERWSIQGDILTSIDPAYPNEPTVLKIISISNDKLVLEGDADMEIDDTNGNEQKVRARSYFKKL
ncbi:MAG: lipocalin family protein [Flavobacteriaceae bacterium]|jgi:hypothetical protein|nr:lipocalin family protein [Flavobacteriaceae bacterium]